MIEYSEEPRGPDALAKRMASYIRDPQRIRALVLREYGRAPGAARIPEMIADHERLRERFAKRNGGRIA